MVLVVYLILIYGGLLTLILFSLFLFLLVKKVLSSRLEVKRGIFKEKIFRHLTAYITSSKPISSRLLQQKVSWKFDTVIETLYELSVVLNSEEERGRIERICDELGIYQTLKTELHDRRWWVAAEGTRKVGCLRLKMLIPEIKGNLSHSHYEVWSASARVLAILEPDILLSFIVEQGRNHEARVLRMVYFLHLKESKITTDLILDRVEGTSPSVKKMLVKILGKHPYPQAISFLENELFSEEIEIRIAALASLGEIGITSQEERILELLMTGTWMEKVAAIKACRQCGIRRSLPILVQSLSHPEWWVRFRAAEALYDFGKEGRKELERCKLTHDDPFSRDMARKVLEEREAEGQLL